MTALITPQWPLPAGVRACSSLRTGGVSQPPFDSLNLGLHTGDSPEDVARNRAILAEGGRVSGHAAVAESGTRNGCCHSG